MTARLRSCGVFAALCTALCATACAPSAEELDLDVGVNQQALAGPGGLVVFENTIATGWSFNGWGWNTSAAHETTIALGTHSAKATHNAAWSGFTLARLTPSFTGNYIDPGTYGTLEFDINPGATVSPALASLRMSLNNGSGYVDIHAYMDQPLAANTWSHVTIPMSVLNSANAPFFRLDWFNNSSLSGFSYYLDNVLMRSAEPPAAATGHSPIAVGTSVVGGQNCQSISWSDADGKPRSADFVNDNYRGGYVRRFTYTLPDGSVRTAQGGVDPSTGYQGFGYLVSHFHNGSNGGSPSADSRDGDYSSTLKNNGASSIVWQGDHHIIRQYTVELHPQRWGGTARGTVYGTVHWVLATGRSHPLFSLTLDSSAEAVGAINADSRAPYGAVGWDGTGGTSQISGVSWGDHRKFETDSSNTGGALTIASNWAYTASNTIPHAYAWANGADAEMGLVGTQPYAQTVSGADSGVWIDSSGAMNGSQQISVNCWGKTSLTATACSRTTDGASAKMPVTWAWPYQLVNYGLGTSATNNKKIAWGTNYGAVGWGTVKSFGNRTFSGHPKISYATQVVLGRHSDMAVESEVQEQEANQSVLLTATVGSIKTSGPAGVGRSDTITYSPAGFDPFYSVWRVQASAAGKSEFSVNTGGGQLNSPIFVVGGAASGTISVKLNGATLTSGVGYFASRNPNGEVWITLNVPLSGSSTLAIGT